METIWWDSHSTLNWSQTLDTQLGLILKKFAECLHRLGIQETFIQQQLQTEFFENHASVRVCPLQRTCSCNRQAHCRKTWRSSRPSGAGPADDGLYFSRGSTRYRHSKTIIIFKSSLLSVKVSPCLQRLLEDVSVARQNLGTTINELGRRNCETTPGKNTLRSVQWGALFASQNIYKDLQKKSASCRSEWELDEVLIIESPLTFEIIIVFESMFAVGAHCVQLSMMFWQVICCYHEWA